MFGGQALRECTGVRIAMKELLGSGTYGAVHRACFNEDCHAAVKLQPLITQQQGEEFAREYGFSKRASDRGYGPRILHACVAKDPTGAYVGLLVTEQFDGSLQEFPWCNDADNARFVAEELGRIVHEMHSDGIVHADLLPKNLLYRANEQGKITDLKATDWGLSFFTAQPPSVEMLDKLVTYHFYEPKVATFGALALESRPLLENVIANPFLLDQPMQLLADQCASKY